LNRTIATLAAGAHYFASLSGATGELLGAFVFVQGENELYT